MKAGCDVLDYVPPGRSEAKEAGEDERKFLTKGKKARADR